MIHISFIPTYAKSGRSCDISYSICKKLSLSKVPILINNSVYINSKNCMDISFISVKSQNSCIIYKSLVWRNL